ncbi:transposon TF2-1 polyprotein, partial [Trifolium medium]|nr:transposon TF2-1 polyprotein [Trifolium medium]
SSIKVHETLMGGHAGVVKTLKQLSANFYWDNMRQEPLPIPSHVWEDVSMDFVTGLPPSLGYTVLFVVVDCFSKGIHLGTLPTGFTAYKVVDLFTSMVCKHHGIPRSIITDRDPIFISRFWTELFKYSGTILRMSSSYHPQTDRQTEVMNRTIEQYFRAFAHHKPSLWARYIPWAKYHYNTSTHVASSLTPFEVIYGKPPPAIPGYIQGTSQVDACDAILSSRDEILTLLRKNLTKAQQAMKVQADKHRRDTPFAVGSWVYVKLQPYRQVSLYGARYNKLSKRFYGPYEVTSRIGPVAYKL